MYFKITDTDHYTYNILHALTLTYLTVTSSSLKPQTTFYNRHIISFWKEDQCHEFIE